jgi:formylglycine-generating enzyme required for sulfatase activity
MWTYLRSSLLLTGLVLFAIPASAVTIDWVLVGDPGNPADTPSTNCFAANCGSVGYTYYISKYEVTNAQYAEFLNAKAGSDPLGLWSGNMGNLTFGGITRSGSSGSYTYSAIAGREDMPVHYLSFYDALRFTNWLNNGQGSGDTETGAYTLLGGLATPLNGLTVTRNALATTFLPSENEWYKAAYYSPGGVYFDYPAGTNTQTTCAAPGATPNTANCGNAVGFLTSVGSYTGSASPYGTFDQGGNALEWNEQIILSNSYRGLRGGKWDDVPSSLRAAGRSSLDPTVEGYGRSFRVASLVPEPSTSLLLMTGMLGLARWRRRPA